MRSAAAPCSRVSRLAQATAALREALGITEESAQQAVQTLASTSREARNFFAAVALSPLTHFSARLGADCGELRDALQLDFHRCAFFSLVFLSPLTREEG